MTARLDSRVIGNLKLTLDDLRGGHVISLWAYVPPEPKPNQVPVPDANRLTSWWLLRQYTGFSLPGEAEDKFEELCAKAHELMEC